MRLHSSNSHLMLEITDDGIGIAADQPGKLSGLGMHIMQNRAGVIQAKLSIAPAATKGTKVTCTLVEELIHATAKPEGNGLDRR